MRIAFISYEFPPDTGVGGIGTYVRQIASSLSERKISVEVICASTTRSGTVLENQFLSITRIQCRNTEEFRKLSPVLLAERHQARPFDLVEVPEYGAEGLHVKDAVPSIPLVVKLHTPKFLIKELNDHYYDKLALRKLKKAIGLAYKKNNDPEYQAILKADYITSPSKSLIAIVANKWNIDKSKIHLAPNPYFPSPELTTLQQNNDSFTVLYIGRLETRKGVYNLAKAIPFVLAAMPNVQFIFLGRDSRGPRREKSMRSVMLREIGAHETNVSFIDHVPLTEIPEVISRVATCVFPSLWENFPNVCLEAMTSGRAIVASRNGGMADMIGDIDGGALVDPYHPKEIADSIINVLSHKELMKAAGDRNRQKAIQYYGGSLLDELTGLYSSFISDFHLKSNQ